MRIFGADLNAKISNLNRITFTMFPLNMKLRKILATDITTSPYTVSIIVLKTLTVFLITEAVSREVLKYLFLLCCAIVCFAYSF